MYQTQRKFYTPYVFAAAVVLLIVVIFSLLGKMLTPFITAAVLAYMLNPIGCYLTRYMPRVLASFFAMLLGVILVLLLLLLVVPMLLQQLISIVHRLPVAVAYIQMEVLPWWNASSMGNRFPLDSQQILTLIRDNAVFLQQYVQRLMPLLLQKSSGLASAITNIVLLPLLLYYFLVDWDKWSATLHRAVPRRYLPVYDRVAGNLNRVLGEFMRGQILVMLIMSTLYAIGLESLGLNSGFSIGIVAGMLVFVPYLGAFTGLLLATLAALLQFGTWQGVLPVWGLFLVGQLLESYVITPKIVGERIGLSPFWIIFALMAFGTLFGFIGMLAALPLAATCWVLLQEMGQYYTNSHFYRRKK